MASRTRQTATGSVAALPASIYQHGQSTLPDGRVIISGGYLGSAYTSAVYVYTPNSNTWEVTETIPASFRQHGQSMLNDGRVMISGGYNTVTPYGKDVYIYAPDNDMLTAMSSLPIGGYGLGQSTLLNSKVLTSGSTGNNYLVYEVGTNTWHEIASMPKNHWGHSQSTLTDGTVFVGAGYSDAKGYYNTAYVYKFSDTNEASWLAVASIPTDYGFAWHGQSALFDNKILISGGWNNHINNNYTYRNTTYIYKFNTNTWNDTAPIATGTRWHGQSTLADGRVLISGGNDGTTNLSAAYIYTPAGWEGIELI